jgi:FkbM family methyltransferase
VEIIRIAEHTIVTDLLPKVPVILDLGGNQGEFSRAMKSRFGADVFMVEPLPKLAANLIGTNIGPVLIGAVAGKRGEIDLFVNPNRCATLLESMQEESAERIQVKTFTLNDVIEWSGVTRVNLLKVDIEGAELDMFESTPDETWSKFDQITIEFHDFVDAAQIPRIKSAIKRLDRNGFLHVKMSFHTFGDIVFINKNRISFSGFELIRLRMYKYWVGINRIFSRFFSRIRRSL